MMLLDDGLEASDSTMPISVTEVCESLTIKEELWKRAFVLRGPR